MAHPGGAPSKLTPSVHDAIVEYVRSGFDWRLAHEFSGISRRSAYRWRARGMHEREGIYHALRDALERAAHEFAEMIDRQQPGSWEWATASERGAVGVDSSQDQSVALLQLVEHQRLTDQRLQRALQADDWLPRLLLDAQGDKDSGDGCPSS